MKKYLIYLMMAAVSWNFPPRHPSLDGRKIDERANQQTEHPIMA